MKIYLLMTLFLIFLQEVSVGNYHHLLQQDYRICLHHFSHFLIFFFPVKRKVKKFYDRGGSFLPCLSQQVIVAHQVLVVLEVRVALVITAMVAAP